MTVIEHDGAPVQGAPSFGRRERFLAAVRPRRPLAQAALLAVVIGVLALAGSTVLANMARLGLTPGFGFLGRPAGFEIGESLIPYAAGDTYGRALLAGLVNTIAVSALGCVLATVIGVALGVARLSGNLLLSGFVQGYIEIVRNTPLLLQLFFWSATAHALPPPRQALSPIDGVYLSSRGVFLPGLQAEGALGWAVALAAAFALGAALYALAWRPKTRRTIFGLAGAAATFSAAAVLLGVSGLSVDTPRLGGFNITGGMGLSPEFAALLVGLSVHASAAVAEIVRSGIESVPKGQWEASQAVGLSKGRTLRLVVLPQALRVIVPLMTSTYLDLTKNSSLAVAIGFPDLVSIVNTSANQTGQAIESILILVGAYLGLNLAVSFAMNRYDARLAARGYAGR